MPMTIDILWYLALHEEDGYITTVDRIFLDQERCRLTVTIEGEKIKDVLDNYKDASIYINGWRFRNCLRKGQSSFDKYILK